MPQNSEPPSQPALGWKALLAEFRAMGGVGENVTLRRGSRGRGIFPIDPARHVRVRVPAHLLVPTAQHWRTRTLAPGATNPVAKS